MCEFDKNFGKYTYYNWRKANKGLSEMIKNKKK